MPGYLQLAGAHGAEHFEVARILILNDQNESYDTELQRGPS
jgi:hypothetical protein